VFYEREVCLAHAREKDDISCYLKRGRNEPLEGIGFSEGRLGDNSPEFSTPVSHSMQRIAICSSQSDIRPLSLWQTRTSLTNSPLLQRSPLLAILLDLTLDV